MTTVEQEAQAFINRHQGAQDLIRLCQEAAELTVCMAGDGGLTVEVEKPPTTRDVLFALPDKGTPLYFTADNQGGFWQAGIVDDWQVVQDLVAWVNGGSYPTRGLVVG